MAFKLKVLILNDLFNEEIQESFKLFRALISYHNKTKLNLYIKNLKRNYGKDLTIKLINYHPNIPIIKGVHNITVLSDFRHELTRKEYLNLVEKVKKTTKDFNIKFQECLNQLKIFHIGGIQLADLLEIHLIRFFNPYLGEIELVFKLIETEKPDEIIFYNINPYFLEFFKKSKFKTQIKVFNANFYFFIKKWITRLVFLRYNLIKLILPLLKRYRGFPFSNKKKDVIAVANSKNQYNSVEPIIKRLSKEKDLNIILYAQKYYINLSNLSKYIRFMRKTANELKNYKKLFKTTFGLNFNVFNLFEHVELPILFSMIFNEYYYLEKNFNRKKPSLITISNELRVESKLITKFCKLKGIPTIYIPHASVPIEGEVICKKEFTYLALWGERDIEYYLNLGMEKSKLKITGNPRFEYFYKDEVKGLTEVKDMFSDRVYTFEPNKKTIILATSPYDIATKKKLIEIVVNALKKLDLIDNLIIKLHPAESGLLHKQVANSLNVNPIIVRDYNILDLIKSSHLLISVISSIILESMMMGIPVILAEFVNLGFMYIQPYNFTNKENIKVAENQETLISIIKDLFENREKFLEYSKNIQQKARLFSYYDKNEPPTERIVNLILNNIEKQN